MCHKNPWRKRVEGEDPSGRILFQNSLNIERWLVPCSFIYYSPDSCHCAVCLLCPLSTLNISSTPYNTTAFSSRFTFPVGRQLWNLFLQVCSRRWRKHPGRKRRWWEEHMSVKEERKVSKVVGQCFSDFLLGISGQQTKLRRAFGVRGCPLACSPLRGGD